MKLARLLPPGLMTVPIFMKSKHVKRILMPACKYSLTSGEVDLAIADGMIYWKLDPETVRDYSIVFVYGPFMCGDVTAIGCTWPDYQRIVITLNPSTHTTCSKVILHELGHVKLDWEYGDCDPDHKRKNIWDSILN